MDMGTLSVAVIALYFFILCCGSYLWILALAGIPRLRPAPQSGNLLKYAVAIAAHNEAKVIPETINNIKALDYPNDLYDIYVVADFCTDETSALAREAGATCFERSEGEHRGKGEALIWLFQHIFSSGGNYDAIIIFDADTKPQEDFLQVINNRVNAGALVVQGQHKISNPRDGWYPALAWSMMTIDNRYANHGRQNLGLSPKLMGDSVCFKTGILRKMGWGSGLTDDYDFRFRLLLEGIKIHYEPYAVGYGQAPKTWKDAQTQRLRWLRGTSEAGRDYRKELIKTGIKKRELAQLDGVIGSLIPSYSSLTLVTIVAFVLSLTLDNRFFLPLQASGVFLLSIWFVYPLLGLMLEKAPAWAFLAILTGPIYMLWRSWLRLRAIFTGSKITWVRTPHT